MSCKHASGGIYKQHPLISSQPGPLPAYASQLYTIKYHALRFTNRLIRSHEKLAEFLQLSRGQILVT